jgi:small subunit ribosomal protein S17
MKVANPKKAKMLKGKVVSDKMNKTRVVNVVRFVKHSLYGKVLRKSSRFYAHDEQNKSVAGDIVEISSVRPLSKLKRWRITKIITKAEK